MSLINLKDPFTHYISNRENNSVSSSTNHYLHNTQCLYYMNNIIVLFSSHTFFSHSAHYYEALVNDNPEGEKKILKDFLFFL